MKVKQSRRGLIKQQEILLEIDFKIPCNGDQIGPHICHKLYNVCCTCKPASSRSYEIDYEDVCGMKESIKLLDKIQIILV